MNARQKKEKQDDLTLLGELRNAEKNHSCRLKELIVMKRRGDWGAVAEKIGISKENAVVAFGRVYSKRHHEVVDALEEVIENRLKNLRK